LVGFVTGVLANLAASLAATGLGALALFVGVGTLKTGLGLAPYG